MTGSRSTLTHLQARRSGLLRDRHGAIHVYLAPHHRADGQ
jgi:hypothetical protein